MLTAELKISLHQMIEQEGDEQVLSHIKILLEESRTAPVEELGGQSINDFNKEMDEVESEIDNGIFSSQEEVTTRFDKLFGK